MRTPKLLVNKFRCTLASHLLSILNYLKVILAIKYCCKKIMAEREGFEPSIRDKPYTPLAGERLQPLGDLSSQRRQILPY